MMNGTYSQPINQSNLKNTKFRTSPCLSKSEEFATNSTTPNLPATKDSPSLSPTPYPLSPSAHPPLVSSLSLRTLTLTTLRYGNCHLL